MLRVDVVEGTPLGDVDPVRRDVPGAAFTRFGTVPDAATWTDRTPRPSCRQSSTGIVTRSDVPPPGGLVTSKRPPTASTRSVAGR